MYGASGTSPSTGSLHFLNLEYWFRLIYEIFFKGGNTTPAQLIAELAHLWVWVTLVGYAITVACIAVIVYSVVRLYEQRALEAERYGPLPHISEDETPQHARWKHIEQLMESSNQSDWRQAIIEADIFLGDILTRQEYHGETIAEQLKQITPSQLNSIDDAWEAHKVRNEIAHQGSAYPLSETMARRVMARYENVFRELRAL